MPKNVRELEFWKYKSQNQILGQHNGTLPKKRSIAQNWSKEINMIFLSWLMVVWMSQTQWIRATSTDIYSHSKSLMILLFLSWFLKKKKKNWTATAVLFFWHYGWGWGKSKHKKLVFFHKRKTIKWLKSISLL